MVIVIVHSKDAIVRLIRYMGHFLRPLLSSLYTIYTITTTTVKSLLITIVITLFKKKSLIY